MIEHTKCTHAGRLTDSVLAKDEDSVLFLRGLAGLSTSFGAKVLHLVKVVKVLDLGAKKCISSKRILVIMLYEKSLVH